MKKKMLKRVLAVALSGMMLSMGLAGCGNSNRGGVSRRR